MKPVRAVFLALLTLTGMVVGVSLAAGVTTSSPTTSTGTERVGSADLDAATTNASLGTRISAFMQSSAAQADGAVDAGMWTATYDNTSNESERSRLIDGHTETLRSRLADIRQRKQELIEQREAGEISRLKYESEMGSLVGRYVSLNEAINETSTRAESTGANTTELADLREESKDVAGPEVAEAARSLSGVDAPGLDRAANRSNGSVAGNANATTGTGERGNGTGRAKTDARNTTRSEDGPGNRTDEAGSARANRSVNASANANASVGVNATLTATGNATVSTQATATAGGNASGRSNATANGPPDDRNEGSNARSNASNRSDADRKPATERPTRTVTSPDTATKTAAARSTTGSTSTPDATAAATETETGANATAGTGGTTEFTTAG